MSHCGDEKESNAGKIIGQSTINNLNYDCLAEIFRYLPLEQRLDMAEVCKHWKKASRFAWDDLATSLNFSQLAAIDIPELPKSLMNNRDIVRLLKSCGDRVTELVIGDPFSSRILLSVGTSCKNLRKLELIFKSYDVKWSQFLPFLEQLEFLKISYLKGKFPQELFFNSLPETLVDIEIWGDVTDNLLITNNVEKECASIPRCGYKKNAEGSEIVTKHDMLMSSRLNACRVLEFPPGISTGDTGGFDVKLNKKVFNTLRAQSCMLCQEKIKSKTT